MLYKKNTLEDQFKVFHGSYYLNNAINLLNKKYQKDFKKFLNRYSLYPYNMVFAEILLFYLIFMMKYFLDFLDVKNFSKIEIY